MPALAAKTLLSCVVCGSPLDIVAQVREMIVYDPCPCSCGEGAAANKLGIASKSLKPAT